MKRRPPPLAGVVRTASAAAAAGGAVGGDESKEEDKGGASLEKGINEISIVVGDLRWAGSAGVENSSDSNINLSTTILPPVTASIREESGEEDHNNNNKHNKREKRAGAGTLASQSLDVNNVFASASLAMSSSPSSSIGGASFGLGGGGGGVRTLGGIVSSSSSTTSSSSPLASTSPPVSAGRVRLTLSIDTLVQTGWESALAAANAATTATPSMPVPIDEGQVPFEWTEGGGSSSAGSSASEVRKADRLWDYVIIDDKIKKKQEGKRRRRRRRRAADGDEQQGGQQQEQPHKNNVNTSSSGGVGGGASNNVSNNSSSSSRQASRKDENGSGLRGIIGRMFGFANKRSNNNNNNESSNFSSYSSDNESSCSSSSSSSSNSSSSSDSEKRKRSNKIEPHSEFQIFSRNLLPSTSSPSSSPWESNNNSKQLQKKKSSSSLLTNDGDWPFPDEDKRFEESKSWRNISYTYKSQRKIGKGMIAAVWFCIVGLSCGLREIFQDPKKKQQQQQQKEQAEARERNEKSSEHRRRKQHQEKQKQGNQIKITLDFAEMDEIGNNNNTVAEDNNVESENNNADQNNNNDTKRKYSMDNQERRERRREDRHRRSMRKSWIRRIVSTWFRRLCRLILPLVYKTIRVSLEFICMVLLMLSGNIHYQSESCGNGFGSSSGNNNENNRFRSTIATRTLLSSIFSSGPSSAMPSPASHGGMGGRNSPPPLSARKEYLPIWRLSSDGKTPVWVNPDSLRMSKYSLRFAGGMATEEAFATYRSFRMQGSIRRSFSRLILTLEFVILLIFTSQLIHVDMSFNVTFVRLVMSVVVIIAGSFIVRRLSSDSFANSSFYYYRLWYWKVKIWLRQSNLVCSTSPCAASSGAAAAAAAAFGGSGSSLMMSGSTSPSSAARAQQRLDAQVEYIGTQILGIVVPALVALILSFPGSEWRVAYCVASNVIVYIMRPPVVLASIAAATFALLLISLEIFAGLDTEQGYFAGLTTAAMTCMALVVSVAYCYQIEKRDRRQFAESSLGKLAMEAKYRILCRMLPRNVVSLVTQSDRPYGEHFDSVAVLFAEVTGFEEQQMDPKARLSLLNAIFSELDQLTEKHRIFKVESIGPIYMCASGLPERTSSLSHTVRMAIMAAEMLERMTPFRYLNGEPIHLKIGMHLGPVVAGVIGRMLPRYRLFGDTVNTASRMCSHGARGKIHCSSAIADCLMSYGVPLQTRGLMEVKGKGVMHTYWLIPPSSPITALSNAASGMTSAKGFGFDPRVAKKWMKDRKPSLTNLANSQADSPTSCDRPPMTPWGVVTPVGLTPGTQRYGRLWGDSPTAEDENKISVSVFIQNNAAFGPPDGDASSEHAIPTIARKSSHGILITNSVGGGSGGGSGANSNTSSPAMRSSPMFNSRTEVVDPDGGRGMIIIPNLNLDDRSSYSGSIAGAGRSRSVESESRKANGALQISLLDATNQLMGGGGGGDDESAALFGTIRNDKEATAAKINNNNNNNGKRGPSQSSSLASPSRKDGDEKEKDLLSLALGSSCNNSSAGDIAGEGDDYPQKLEEIADKTVAVTLISSSSSSSSCNRPLPGKRSQSPEAETNDRKDENPSPKSSLRLSFFPSETDDSDMSSCSSSLKIRNCLLPSREQSQQDELQQQQQHHYHLHHHVDGFPPQQQQQQHHHYLHNSSSASSSQLNSIVLGDLDPLPDEQGLLLQQDLENLVLHHPHMSRSLLPHHQTLPVEEEDENAEYSPANSAMKVSVGSFLDSGISSSTADEGGVTISIFPSLRQDSTQQQQQQQQQAAVVEITPRVVVKEEKKIGVDVSCLPCVPSVASPPAPAPAVSPPPALLSSLEKVFDNWLENDQSSPKLTAFFGSSLELGAAKSSSDEDDEDEDENKEIPARCPDVVAPAASPPAAAAAETVFVSPSSSNRPSPQSGDASPLFAGVPNRSRARRSSIDHLIAFAGASLLDNQQSPQRTKSPQQQAKTPSPIVIPMRGRPPSSPPMDNSVEPANRPSSPGDIETPASVIDPSVASSPSAPPSQLATPVSASRLPTFRKRRPMPLVTVQSVRNGAEDSKPSSASKGDGTTPSKSGTVAPPTGIISSNNNTSTSRPSSTKSGKSVNFRLSPKSGEEAYEALISSPSTKADDGLFFVEAPTWLQQLRKLSATWPRRVRSNCARRTTQLTNLLAIMQDHPSLPKADSESVPPENLPLKSPRRPMVFSFDSQVEKYYRYELGRQSRVFPLVAAIFSTILVALLMISSPKTVSIVMLSLFSFVMTIVAALCKNPIMFEYAWTFAVGASQTCLWLFWYIIDDSREMQAACALVLSVIVGASVVDKFSIALSLGALMTVEGLGLYIFGHHVRESTAIWIVLLSTIAGVDGVRSKDLVNRRRWILSQRTQRAERKIVEVISELLPPVVGREIAVSCKGLDRSSPNKEDGEGVWGGYGSNLASPGGGTAAEMATATLQLMCPFSHEKHSVGLLFADIVSFTPLSAGLSPEELVDLLRELFGSFDLIAQQFGVYKVETIGDCYFCASGVPTEIPLHLVKLARTALAMVTCSQEFSRKRNKSIEMRIGIHCGPVVAGVVGYKMPRYHLFGPNTNIAQKTEARSSAGVICVTRAFATALKEQDHHGEFQLKEKILSASSSSSAAAATDSGDVIYELSRAVAIVDGVDNEAISRAKEAERLKNVVDNA